MSQSTEKRSSHVVLAIFANGRGFGLAVMKNALSLIDAYMVSLKYRPVANKHLLEKLKEKIDYYKPDVVILEEPTGYGSRKGKRVHKFIDSIREHTRSVGLKVFSYSRNDIRFVFSNFNASTKFEIANVICENIPTLEKRRPEKRKYYQSEQYAMSIFDAVSLGITHYYQSN